MGSLDPKAIFFISYLLLLLHPKSIISWCNRSTHQTKGHSYKTILTELKLDSEFYENNSKLKEIKAWKLVNQILKRHVNIFMITKVKWFFSVWVDRFTALSFLLLHVWHGNSKNDSRRYGRKIRSRGWIVTINMVRNLFLCQTNFSCLNSHSYLLQHARVVKTMF